MEGWTLDRRVSSEEGWLILRRCSLVTGNGRIRNEKLLVRQGRTVWGESMTVACLRGCPLLIVRGVSLLLPRRLCVGRQATRLLRWSGVRVRRNASGKVRKRKSSSASSCASSNGGTNLCI